MMLADWPGLPVALALLAAAALLTGLALRGRPARAAGGWRWALGASRAMALALLLLLLWDPSRVTETQRLDRNRVLVLFDTSGSMSVEGADGRSRLDEAVAAYARGLRPEDDGAPAYRTYGFDAGCSEAASVAELHPAGASSDLAQAVDFAARGLSAGDGPGRAVGAVILTDGQADDKRVEAYPVLATGDTPVLLVGIGAPGLHGDVAVEALEAPASTAAHAAYPVRVRVRTRGPVDGPVVLSLLADGRPVGTRELTAHEGVTSWSFVVPAGGAGQQVLEAHVRAAGPESNAHNNVHRSTVQVCAPSELRVLVYSQVVNSDIGKVRSALARDERVQLDFRLDALIEPSPEAGDKLPADAAGFGAYDVVVLGPCAFDDLGAARLQALYDFVVGGGGLVLLPGRDRYDFASAASEQLKSLLPAEFAPEAGPLPAASRGPLVPTDGRWQDLLSAQRKAGELPGLRPFHGSLTDKPAAFTWAKLGQTPLLAAHRVGRGHVVLVNSYGLQAWYREDQEGGALRELLSRVTAAVGSTADDGAAIELFAERAADDQQDVVFQAIVFDAARHRAEHAGVLLHVGGAVAGMDEVEPGRYMARVAGLPDESVLVRVEAELAGQFLGERAQAFQLPVARGEMDRTEPDRDFLARLAPHVGARYVDVERFPAEVAGLFPAASVTTEKGLDSAWRRWPLLAALCALLCFNWFLRRAIGLA